MLVHSSRRLRRSCFPLVCSCALLGPLLAAAQELPVARAPDAAVEREELEAHLEWLASDALGGRDTASSGSYAAALYLARELKSAGLAPGVPLEQRFDADPTGGYLQDIGLLEERYLAEPELRVKGASGTGWQTLVLGEDYDVQQPLKAGARLRIVLVTEDQPLPAADAGVALFLEGSSKQREQKLAAAGRADGHGFGLLLSAGSKSPGKRRDEAPRARLVRAAGLETAVVAELRLRGKVLEQLHSGALGELEFALDFERVPAKAYNVLALLPGAGERDAPGLAQEAVVLSAHYDHLGTRPLKEGESEAVDLVFNGADDDGSGTAVLLEIAEALALGPPLARTVVVLCATGEERGLLGTFYYIDHPSVPLAATVANLNFEMLGRPDPSLAPGAEARGLSWFTGYERSTLGPAYQEAGLAILPDPHPSENFFQRSDNYAFARLGIVGQTLSSYNLHQDYHTVRDEISGIDFEHLSLCARAGLEASRLLASGALRPEWLPGMNPKK